MLKVRIRKSTNMLQTHYHDFLSVTSFDIIPYNVRAWPSQSACNLPSAPLLHLSADLPVLSIIHYCNQEPYHNLPVQVAKNYSFWSFSLQEPILNAIYKKGYCLQGVWNKILNYYQLAKFARYFFNWTANIT